MPGDINLAGLQLTGDEWVRMEIEVREELLAALIEEDPYLEFEIVDEAA